MTHFVFQISMNVKVLYLRHVMIQKSASIHGEASTVSVKEHNTERNVSIVSQNYLEPCRVGKNYFLPVITN